MTTSSTFRFRADRRSVLFVAVALGLMTVHWTGIFRHPLTFLASLAFAFFACVINHNHQHCATFRHAWLNRLFGVAITWAIGQPAMAIRPMHMMNHHVHNNDEHDHVRATIVNHRSNLLNLLIFPFVAIWHYAREKSAILRRWRQQQPELHRQLVLERWTLYPLLAVLLLASPGDTLIFILLPWFAGQWGILAVNHVQHDGCDHDSRYNHSRNFTGRWLNWWTFNNGFHTAHHLQPRRHWTLVPDLHREILAELDPSLQENSLIVGLMKLYGPSRREIHQTRKTS